MNQQLKKEFYNKLKREKINMNWNKNPIKMSIFLSFLTVDVDIISNHLGSDMGWTKRENKSIGLIISGGCVNNEEYLDSLQFGEKLSNQYNNYVNPFYIFEILTDAGKSFFVEYYKDEINAIIKQQNESVSFYELKLSEEKALMLDIQNEVKKLTSCV